MLYKPGCSQIIEVHLPLPPKRGTKGEHLHRRWSQGWQLRPRQEASRFKGCLGHRESSARPGNWVRLQPDKVEGGREGLSTVLKTPGSAPGPTKRKKGGGDLDTGV